MSQLCNCCGGVGKGETAATPATLQVLTHSLSLLVQFLSLSRTGSSTIPHMSLGHLLPSYGSQRVCLCWWGLKELWLCVFEQCCVYLFCVQSVYKRRTTTSVMPTAASPMKVWMVWKCLSESHERVSQEKIIDQKKETISLLACIPVKVFKLWKKMQGYWINPSDINVLWVGPTHKERWTEKKNDVRMMGKSEQLNWGWSDKIGKKNAMCFL